MLTEKFVSVLPSIFSLKLQFPIGEFDMVVCDTRELTCRIYEGKYSMEQTPEQYRHLRDGKLSRRTVDRSIKKKAVLWLPYITCA